MGRIETTAVNALTGFGNKLLKYGSAGNSESDALLMLWFLNYMATESDSSMRFCENADMFVQDSEVFELINKIYDNVKHCLAQHSCLIWPDMCSCEGENHPQWQFNTSSEMIGCILTTFDDDWLVLINDDNTVIVANDCNNSSHEEEIPQPEEDTNTKLYNLLRQLGFITEQDVPTNLSSFHNDLGYVTEDDIPTVPTNLSAFDNDANYITSADIPTIPTVPTDISAFTNDAGYITSADIPTIPTVPTNVSAFDNDAGYITQDDVPAPVSVPTNVSQFNNDAGYLTGYTETDPEFSAWDKDYNDLTNTPTIPTVPTDVSSFNNDAGYLTQNDISSVSSGSTVPSDDTGSDGDIYIQYENNNE